MIYFVEQSVVEVMTRFFSFLPRLSVLGAQLLNCFISCLTAHCKTHQGWKKVTKMLHFYFNIIYIYIYIYFINNKCNIAHFLVMKGFVSFLCICRIWIGNGRLLPPGKKTNTYLGLTHTKPELSLSNLISSSFKKKKNICKHGVVSRHICLHTKPTQNDVVHMPDQYVELYFCHRDTQMEKKTWSMCINLGFRLPKLRIRLDAKTI